MRLWENHFSHNWNVSIEIWHALLETLGRLYSWTAVQDWAGFPRHRGQADQAQGFRYLHETALHNNIVQLTSEGPTSGKDTVRYIQGETAKRRNPIVH